MMFPCGDSLRNAWISRRLLTWSSESKWFFMHLMATYLPFLMHCAFSTSLKVPSPFLATRRYSARGGGKETRRQRGILPIWLIQHVGRALEGEGRGGAASGRLSGTGEPASAPDGRNDRR